MSIVFFTDPHLGLKRSSHTTAASQALYRKTLFNQALKAANVTKDLSSKVICLGDLFDTYSNTEEVIFQGTEVAANCDYVLSGNHDIRNRSDSFSSLQLLNASFEAVGSPELGQICLSPDPSIPYFHEAEHLPVPIYFVPHCYTQEVFVGSLEALIKKVKKQSFFRVLCLHCNVGDGFGDIEGDGSSLWLTSELQEKLLEHFNYILVGHEHEPKTLHDGRLVILGNTFPVSFGEISDRFAYILDETTHELSKVKIFDKDENYEVITAEALMQAKGEIATSRVLIDITGKVSSSEMPTFYRTLRQFWKTNPDLLAVRKNIETDKPTNAVTSDSKDSERKTLPEIVQEAVKAAGFASEYAEIVGENHE